MGVEVSQAGKPIRELPEAASVVDESFACGCAQRRGYDGEIASDGEQDVVDELETFGGRVLGRPAAKAEGLVGSVGDVPEERAAPAAGIGKGLDMNLAGVKAVVG